MFQLMLFVFVLGYIFIVLEHNVKINKASSALIIGVLTWSIYAIFGQDILSLGYSHSWDEYLKLHPDASTAEGIREFITHHELFHHLSEISSILFFLLGAMTIVEVIDRFQGFRVITEQIKTRDRVKLLWGISFLTFFMSALLDNLTTTIVMVTLARKLLSSRDNRWLFSGMIVIAANAGGAFSPIGDVTTIMLWIGGQVSTLNIVSAVFLPSLVSMIIPLIIMTYKFKGTTEPPLLDVEETIEFTTPHERKMMLALGVLCLVMVPIFKTFTHLPPYMGMLLGLGIIWIVSDIMRRKKTREDRRLLNVTQIIRNLDTPTILFFLGILSAVSSLQSAGQLDKMAEWMDAYIGDVYGIDLMIGTLSAIVDNVPLVAGAMGMYEINDPGVIGYAANFMQDGHFWSFLAYCAGTGGSMLIVGSAAGVAAMGMEKISFGWYFKKISWIAACGYLAGALVYYLQSFFI